MARPVKGDPDGWAPPPRRSTLVRDLVLFFIHLGVYTLVIGTLLATVTGVVTLNGTVSYGAFESSFWPVFWPGFVWGTLIAAQGGAAIFQRRRWMGAVLGAMSSITLGAALLAQFPHFRVLSIVFFCGAVALSGLTVSISIARRPPSVFTGHPGTPVTAPQVATTRGASRRAGMISIPSLLLGTFALVFVLSAIGAATFRSFEVRGSGEVVVRDVSVPAFRSITAEAIDVLTISQGPVPSVRIRGDANLVDYVRAFVIDDRLDLTFDPGLPTPVRTDAPLAVDVVVSDLDELYLDGKIATWLDGLELAALRVVIDGSSVVEITDLAADSLAIVIRGSASAAVSGTATVVDLDVSGTGNADLLDLVARDLSISAWGDSRSRLGPVTNLTYRQIGDASIRYPSTARVSPDSSAEVPFLVFDAEIDDRSFPGQ